MLDTLISSKTRLNLLVREKELGETVLRRIGPVEAVYLTGALASGLDADTIDVRIVGPDVNTAELDRLVAKPETVQPALRSACR